MTIMMQDKKISDFWDVMNQSDFRYIVDRRHASPQFINGEEGYILRFVNSGYELITVLRERKWFKVYYTYYWRKKINNSVNENNG